MKNYFKKEYRFTSDLTKDQRRDFALLNARFIVVYLLSSMFIICACYFILNMLGSIAMGSKDQALSDFIKCFPYLLGYFSLVYVSHVLNKLCSPLNKEKRNKLLFRSSIVIIILGIIPIIYIIFGRIFNIYSSLNESGYTYSILPFDSIVLSLIYIFIGLLQLLEYKKRLVSKSCVEITYKISNKPKFLSSIFLGLFYIISLASLGLLIYGEISFDGSKNIDPNANVTLYLIAIRLMLLVPIITFIVYKFIYAPLKEEYKQKFQFIFSLIMFVFSIVSISLYIISMVICPNAPNICAYGILFIDMTATKNVFTYLYIIINSLIAFVPLINALLKKVKKTKEIK